jgi:hypothetical protein
MSWCDLTPCREAVFQAVTKLIRTHLDGTIRLMTSSGSPVGGTRCMAKYSIPFIAFPGPVHPAPWIGPMPARL